jgi:hypothetical protein
VWIPIDTRLHEHHTTIRMAARLSLPAETVVGLLARLWGMCSDFDSWRLDGPAGEIEGHYRLPAGFLEAMQAVGLATITPEAVSITMTAAISDTAERRREKAAHAARTRWNARKAEHDAQNAEHDAQTCSADARNARACSDAIEGMERGNRRKRGNGSRASSPPALEGAGLSAAAAMREALRAGEAPTTNPAATLRLLGTGT